MKIVCVLMVLATLFGRSKGDVGTCKTVANIGAIGTPGNVELAGTDDNCPGETAECSRPKIVNGAFLTDGVKWGCGACGTPDNCVTCDTANCNIDAAMCFNNANNDASDYCDDGELQCKRAKVDYKGDWTGDENNWGCGTKTDGEENCAAIADNCNTNEKSSLATHPCHNYKKTGDTWAKDTQNPTYTCYTEAVEGCKMPSPKNPAADGAFIVCGNDCASGNGETCQGCDDDNCNDVDSTEDSIVLCKSGVASTDSAEVANLDSVFCADGCERPAVAYGVVQGSVGYGCGTCDNKEDCVSCTTNDCNTYPEATNSHKCFAWTWDTSASKFNAGAKTDCQKGDGEEKCNMPTKGAANPGANDIAHGGCGPCADGKDEVCTTTDAEKNVETTHKCHTWEWNDADGKKTWEFTKDAVDCYTADTATKCSLPEDRSKKDGFVGNGCTACGTDDANCMTTEKEENSGRRVIFSLLALALPIFYALL